MLVNFVVVMVIYVQYIVSYFDIIISQELIDLVNLTFTKFRKLKPMYSNDHCNDFDQRIQLKTKPKELKYFSKHSSEEKG